MENKNTKLSDTQSALVKDMIILFYEKYNGQSNAVIRERIVNILKSKGHRINERSFRAFLEWVRRYDICRKYLLKYHNRVNPAFIVSSNDGYWWTEDVEEMRAFWESQHGRVCEIMKNAHPLYKLFGYDEKQLQIFQLSNAV